MIMGYFPNFWAALRISLPVKLGSYDGTITGLLAWANPGLGCWKKAPKEALGRIPGLRLRF